MLPPKIWQSLRKVEFHERLAAACGGRAGRNSRRNYRNRRRVCHTGIDLRVSNGAVAGAGHGPDDLVAADLVHRIHPLRASASLRSSTRIADSRRHLCGQLLRGKLGSASSTSRVKASAGQRASFGWGTLSLPGITGAT